jgi:carotenoid 1,2-hydratase
MKNQTLSDTHFWNMVSPRSDVTGKIEVFNFRGKELDQIQFRGTGYHDHNFDSRWLPTAVSEWQWGRAHFDDATAVFYRFYELDQQKAMTKLFLIKDNDFSEHNAAFAVTKPKQHIFGLRYPSNLEFLTEKDSSLVVKQNQIIDSSFFYLRFLSEMKLDLNDGKIRQTIGITEHLKPQSLRWRWLDWLVNMRIGRNNKGAFLP